MIWLVSAALTGGITLAVVDMIREARRDRSRSRSRAAHPAGSRQDR